MDLGNGYGHLTYSTLVHPGDTWAEMRESLETYVPEVKRRFCPDAPMGVSLRISNASAETLVDDPSERARLKAWLDERDLYVYTVNAFPFGPFKGELVKEEVYEPDWSTEARTRYTMNVATILTEITGPGVEPTIQTAPLAFRPKVVDDAYVAAFTDNLLRVVAFLMELEKRTGRRVKLALEPEPYCFLETIPETVEYFNNHVYTTAAAMRVAELSGQPLAEVFQGLRRYLGVVFDICHQSVEFEDIEADLQLLVDAAIPIYKLQEASALNVPEVTDEIVRELKRYTDTIYLSQTTELRDGVITRYLNLEDAIEAYDADPGPRSWRTHFHVPVFLDDLGPFRTTRDGIDAALAFHARSPLSTHLEIETYTWDVLPDHLKSGDITDHVIRELEYVRDELGRQAAERVAPGTRV
ncbi:MAG: hypothetical protein GC156_05965 [Actinomycetales bacterium]|nr:hypothetical protein [Actinomycetales bacterium]